MKNLFKISLLLVFLVSCSKNGRTIIVNTQNADGLTTESKLDVNGLEIGQVVEINLGKDGTVNLICEINNNEIQIPLDSKFYSKNLGLLGGKSIGIKMGSANEFIETGMSVTLVEEDSHDYEDVFSKAINEVKSLFGGQHNTDSLLFELRRLNKNMEDLKLERKNN
ncbi:MlaD family protein [Maribacter sp. 2307UL18-2]|uniref:MlaD family protein n=1 Tax=Maribacter sp. 2307UL18-2 TaxID=3386274 RepID=UPI0039BC3372